MTQANCQGICKNLENKLRSNHGDGTGTKVYEDNVYCRNCQKYFLRKYLAETKKGAKVLCPCCHGFARRGASTTAKNNRIKRREMKMNELKKQKRLQKVSQ